MKKRKLFYKIFIPIVTLGIILVIGFSVYIYRSTYRTVSNSLLKDKQSFTTQIRNNLEQKAQTLEHSFLAYSVTSSFAEAMNKPLDYKDYLHIRGVSSELNYISTMGTEYTDYSLISLASNWKIEGNSFSKLRDEEQASLRKKYLEDTSKLFWHPIDNGIRLTLALPVLSEEKYALGIAEIKNRVIDQIVSNDKHNSVQIFNKDGELLYKHGSDLHDKQKEAVLQESLKRSSGMVSQENGDILIYEKSPHNQWLFVTTFTHLEAASAIDSTRSGLIIISGILIILILIFSWRFSLYYTRPIKEIENKLNLKLIEGNEFSQIFQGIDSILTEKEDLETTLQKQKVNLETLFVLNLFHNQLSHNEVIKRLEQFGYPTNQQMVYTSLLIQIDDLCGREESSTDIFLLAIKKLIEEIIPENSRLLPIVLNAETQATIIQIPSVDYSKSARHKLVVDWCEEIRKATSDYLKIKISFGVSQEYDLLVYTQKAKEFAREALRYRYNIGTESIIFYDEILHQKNDSPIAHYPSEAETELFDVIRAGNFSEVTVVFHKLLKDIYITNRNPISLKIALIRLVNNLVELGQILGADTAIFTNSDLYDEVLNPENSQKIEQQLSELLVIPLIESIKNNTYRNLKLLSEKIIKIIHKDYDKELSLETLGEQLHYNPVYLSSVFKNECGETFSDYLQNYRIEIAQKWLLETEMTVKQISERLQYTNSQNFIRFFKRKVHCTPGEYRKSGKLN